MNQHFDQKLQLLSNKLVTLRKNSGFIQRQTKCKDEFLQIRGRVSGKFQILEKSLKFIEERIEKYETKIKSNNKIISQFSQQKHRNVKQLVMEWVQNFNQNAKNAKSNLKAYQVASQVKLNQIQKDNDVVIENLQEKVHKNIRKVKKQIDFLSKKFSQQRQLIKKQFNANKSNIQTILIQNKLNNVQFGKILDGKLLNLNLKMNMQIQLLTQKWDQKDQKTKRILQILIGDQI